MNRIVKAMAAVALSAAAMSSATAGAVQQFIMMPDSTNNRMVLFDPFDGSVISSNYFALASGTPVHAMQVGSEIWVSEQLGDRVSRWDLTGTSVGAITGAMDNIRGMELADGTVFVSNSGTANGAPGHALRMFDTSGNSLGSFATAASDPFSVLDHQGSLLVGSVVANDDIHRYSYAGASQGTFHNTASLSFVEQMWHATNGDILAAAFSSNIVARLDPNTGALLSSFTASGARGVIQLGNGNVMWSNSSGAHVFNTSTGQSTQVYAGGGRFFDILTIPAPGALTLLGVAGFVGSRRRRN